MKVLSYVFLVLYYALFIILVRVLDVAWLRGPVFLMIYFLAVPFLLMFLEKMKSHVYVIKTSLWYGIIVIVTDFVLRTTLVYNETVIELNQWNDMLAAATVPYNAWNIFVDLLLGYFLAAVWILLVVGVIYGIGRLKALFNKVKPNVQHSLIHAGIVIVGYAAYSLLIVPLYSTLADLQSQSFFAIEALGYFQMFVVYLVLIIGVLVILYIRENAINLERILHMSFVIFVGIVAFYVLILVNPLFWLLVNGLVSLGETTTAFSYFFLTIAGPILTVGVYMISRTNDDVSKDVIFVYKAIIVLTFGFYTVFTLLAG